MLTRRSFLAALVMAPVAAKAAPVAAAPTVMRWKDRLLTVPAPDGGYYLFTQKGTYHVGPRRDDGDTILELR